MIPVEVRWRRFWERTGASGDGLAAGSDLLVRYGEPHRAYHTIEHVRHCLDEFEDARGLAGDPVAVEMALWYHDAVYDPRAADNEEKSAALARDVARSAGLPEVQGGRVAELIRASTHRRAPGDPDTRLFADIDLSILGQPEGAFDEYERQVRKEYGWVPEPAFRSGRSGILRSFLGRPSLYGTPYFREKYEAAARRNLERSLLRLTGA